MIEIKNLSKQFEGFQAVENLSLRIETGGYFCAAWAQTVREKPQRLA